MVRCSVIIAAAGGGSRMGGEKQFREIGGVPMCMRACGAFEPLSSVDEIVLVVSPDRVGTARMLVGKSSCKKVRAIIAGGATRQKSVLNGLSSLSSSCENVLVHDGARPLVTGGQIEKVIAALRSSEAVVVGVPAIDTIKELAPDGSVAGTLPRERLLAVQTPQGFRASLLREAYAAAERDGFAGTDDSSLVERLGRRVDVIMGSYENIKVTTAFDIALAESILVSRRAKRP